MNSPANMILWKKKIKLKSLQRFLLGILDNSYNGAPVQALVLHLKSLKKGVWNKFLTPFNSHFMPIPIIAIIEFLGIAVAFSIIRKFMYHSAYHRGKKREYLHPSLKVKSAEWLHYPKDSFVIGLFKLEWVDVPFRKNERRGNRVWCILWSGL